MLIALMSRIVITTAHFNDIVSRSLSEAITIAIRREDRGSPLFDRSPDLLQKDIFFTADMQFRVQDRSGSPMDLLMKVIRKRHSTRAFFDPDRKVPARDIRKIIEAARWAPTAHNMQNFAIIVVDDRKVLEKLGVIPTYPSPDFIRENFEQLSMTEEELLQKKVGILGTGFPPAWRDKAQLEAAMNDTTPGTLDETIRGSPAVLVLVYDTRKRAPASEGDVLGMLSLGCVMENMWLMAEDLDIGFQIMSVFSGPVQKEVKKILRIPEHVGISFAVRLGYPVAPSRTLRVRRDSVSFTYHNVYGKP
jgi:nitroreductase